MVGYVVNCGERDKKGMENGRVNELAENIEPAREAIGAGGVMGEDKAIPKMVDNKYTRAQIVPPFIHIPY